MTKLAIVLCFCFVSAKTFCQVFISGEIKNAPPESEAAVTYYNNSIEWQEVKAAKAKLDSEGKFTLSFNLDKSLTAKLTIASQYTDLFLVPKDSLHITDDYSKFDETLHYTGRGAEDNNYLAADVVADFSKKASRYSTFTDADMYKLYIDSLENANKAFFKAHDTPAFTPEFRSYITATIKYRYIDSRWMYKVGYDRENKKFFDKPVPDNYFDFLKALDLDDRQAADNSNYHIALTRYLYEMNDKNTAKEIPDTLPPLQKTEMRITKNYAFRKKVFKEQILDYQLTDFLKHSIGAVATDTKFTEELIKDYKTACKNSEYISIIDNAYAKANKLSAGNAAPDFTLADADGKEVSLASLKGKAVYIDFWATWCVPCIAAMPHSQSLMEKFKDRKDIVFLFVNVSDDKEKWKSFLIKEKMGGVNLYANKEQSDNLFKTFNFSGIPHYVLIDKQGKFINSTSDAEKDISEAAK